MRITIEYEVPEGDYCQLWTAGKANADTDCPQFLAGRCCVFGLNPSLHNNPPTMGFEKLYDCKKAAEPVPADNKEAGK